MTAWMQDDNTDNEKEILINELSLKYPLTPTLSPRGRGSKWGSGSVPTIGSFMTVFDGNTVNPGIETSDDIVIIGRPGPANYRWFFTGGVTSEFGFGTIYSPADYGFGPIVGVMAPDVDPSFLAFIVPTGYNWGTELGLSLSTWYNTTLHDMGLTPGTYSFVLGYANTEVFRVNVIGANPVPLPPAFGLFSLGLAGLAYSLMRKRYALIFA